MAEEESRDGIMKLSKSGLEFGVLAMLLMVYRGNE